MNAVDTNVLLYAHDPRDPVKQSLAANLLVTEKNLVLVWQVACEYVNARRKLAPYGFDMPDAFRNLALIHTSWKPILPGWSAIARTQSLLGMFSLSFFDALLIAVCLESGDQRLYSEDFSAYPKIDSLEIVNPFLP